MAVATKRPKARTSSPRADRWSRARARGLLRAVEGMFHRRDVEALVEGFTPDCVVRFAEQPERRGRQALRAFLTARLARQKDYRLKKTLMALDGNTLANLWEGTWEDARTGKHMTGRGLEVWRMRGGKIVVWDAVFNVWERDGDRTSPIM
jgi:nuclear transport factor 2 (NTF2) superfamily protein